MSIFRRLERIAPVYVWQFVAGAILFAIGIFLSSAARCVP
jgi:hypothetical protein